MEEVEAPRSQGPEEMVLALGAIPLPGMRTEAALKRHGQTEAGRVDMDLNTVPSTRPHGKGPAQPVAPGGEGEDVTSWCKALVISPNLEDPEGRVGFVLDDLSEAYLWQGLEECGHDSVQAINWASELVSRDMYKLAQVRVSSLF